MPTHDSLPSTRWMTRALGFMINSFFLLVLLLSLTNKDGAPPQGWPVLVCLAVCILGVFSACRWTRLGGRIVLAGAFMLCLATLYSAFVTGLPWEGLVLALVYPVPYFIVGSLFLVDGQTVEGHP
jgi:hypothetical protein